jgi:hypothetical protein
VFDHSKKKQKYLLLKYLAFQEGREYRILDLKESLVSSSDVQDKDHILCLQ